MTHLRCSTPRMTSRGTSGNMDVNVCISSLLGTLTVPSPPAPGRAAPANSETHCRTTPLVLEAGLVGCSVSDPGVGSSVGRVLTGGTGGCAVVTISSCSSGTSVARARVRVSGNTLLFLLVARSVAKPGRIQCCEKSTILIRNYCQSSGVNPGRNCTHLRGRRHPLSWNMSERYTLPTKNPTHAVKTDAGACTRAS